jgi:hypothetical protein
VRGKGFGQPKSQHHISFQASVQSFFFFHRETIDMAEALGTASAVLAIAGAAWQSSKFLYDEISRLRGWPSTIQDLRNDLNTIQSVVNPEFLQAVGIRNSTGEERSPDSLAACLRSLNVAIANLNKECKAFRAQLDAATKRSSVADKLSYLDKFSLQFKEGTIKTFQSRLETHKLNVTIALSAVSRLVMQLFDDLLRVIFRALCSLHDVVFSFTSISEWKHSANVC